MGKKIIFIVVMLLVIPSNALGKSGCCSHHGGVSGCSSSGRQICNDGTLSPSCTCTPVKTYIYGCMDKNATNYDSEADRDDGSCRYIKKEASKEKITEKVIQEELSTQILKEANEQKGESSVIIKTIPESTIEDNKIVVTNEEIKSNTDSKIKDESNTKNDSNGVLPLLLLAGIGTIAYKKIKRK